MKTEPEFDSLIPAQSFDRRSFIVTSLGAGFALATQPVMAQTAIKTDETGIVAGEDVLEIIERHRKLMPYNLAGVIDALIIEGDKAIVTGNSKLVT